MATKQFNKIGFTFVCFLLFFSKGVSQFQDEKHIEAALRMMGHRILLRSGDSVSRILPIKKENDSFRMQFESEFEFYPEELVATIDAVVNETGMPSNYVVEIVQCETNAVMYSYAMGDSEQTNIIPCKSRVQPKACYSLLITFIASKVPMASANDVVRGTPYKSSSQTGSVTNFLLIVLLVFSLGGLVYLWKKRRYKNNDPNLIALGEYRFDTRNTELLYKDQRTALTGKEANLLLVLFEAVNTIVEREVILNKVWEDEGDYVGRTLDVFISKLRKKFEGDPKVKIMNIRGVGYKLVIAV